MRRNILLLSLVFTVICGTVTHAQEFQSIKTASRGENPYKAQMQHIKDSVNPMLKTEWGQNHPYNLFTPLVPGKNTHTKTGCVATSMAQVMKYYEFPKQAKDVVNYQYVGDDGKQHSISADLTQSIYEWDKMDNSYQATTDEEHQKAVAQIMYDCGVSVKMQYGAVYSGAFDMDVPNAMIDHFSYDENITYMSRVFDENMTDEKWFSTLYQQLSDGMPVIYGGLTGSYQAHSFVIDGYNKNGEFHIVWGFGDKGGYYNLDEISYQHGHSMVINIKPETSTDIKSPQSTEAPHEIRRFSIDGISISAPQPGINLIQMSDGSTKKVFILN